MLIAFDGGAFQAGASTGIRGCSVGFLNAASQLDRSFRAVLVADPRMGAIPPEALDSLVVKPEIIYAEIAPGGDPPLRGLLTDDPDLRFVVDDANVRGQYEDGWAWYEGPAPQRLFAIASRISRPCDVVDSGDMRPLGVAIRQITIDDRANPPRVVDHGNPQLEEGFYGDEAAWRWTSGRGVVPVGLFPDSGTVRVGVQFGPGHRYRIGGSFDRAFGRIETELRKWSRRLALSRLSSELLANGAQIYLANYYLPVAIPGLKLAAWAYDASPIDRSRRWSGDALEASRHNANFFRSADCIFSIAAQSSRDLTAELGVPDERVVTAGIDIAGDHPSCTPDAVARTRQQYGIADPYILCVGMLEPSQSHLRLIQAYHRLVEAPDGAASPVLPVLAIVGQAGNGYQPVLREIEERGLGQRVKILTDLDADGLSALYSDALFVAYPSLYEGFRPNLLDAVAHRKPIMTSRNSIMAEIAGDAALLVDLEDVISIADGIMRLTADTELRTELVRRGDERRHAGHWPNIARTVLDRLGALLKE